jgi:predicted SprT family Zn-dependent metalloprotease
VQLDEQITEGQIASLSESTGGVKLNWTKSLNTTAGRANWKRETVRTKQADGTETDVRYKHHASIDLAEKVIDDESRLLNVIAHEFCHLANFMVSGITNNPHGKEFKSWAAKCSRAFGHRGIKVTTKHTYEIDFKYIWECVSCGHEHKRHSKSIDPARHRCGKCKDELKQTRPVPRATGGKTAYQMFVKEQMRVVRDENPGATQREVMKLIGEKWKARNAEKEQEKKASASEEDVAEKMVDLTMADDA